MISAFDGQKLRVAGMVSILQRPPTAKGMCFITLEDEMGTFNLVLNPQIYYEHRILLTESPFIWANGKLELHQNVRNIIVTQMGILPIQKILSSISKNFSNRNTEINNKPRMWK